ncbi:DUF11 domain-containing protein [bacterium]|nr:DUF11 domain-containing protein [bacterium]
MVRSDRLARHWRWTLERATAVFLLFLLSNTYAYCASSPANSRQVHSLRALTRGEEVQITNDLHDQWNPAIYGDKIVWQDYRNGNWDIYMYDLSTKKEVQITNDPHDQWWPAIYGDKIVWQDWRNGNLDIYMYDLSIGQEVPICTNGAGQYAPAIYGDKIVWQDYRNGNWDIYMYDLSTKKEVQITNDPHDQWNPAIYGDKIVWEVWRYGKPDIYMYDLSTGQEVPICTNNSDQYAPAIYGDKIVWEDWRNGDSDIYMYDLSAGREIPICTNSALQYAPAIYGDKIVWEDWRNGNCDIYMYDLSIGQEVPICTNGAGQDDPAIYGDKIVWEDERNGNCDIYMYDLSVDTTPPTAPKNLTATVVGLEEIDLSWEASTDSGGSGLDGYEVMRRESGGTFSRIARVDANTLTYKDKNVFINITYEYRVRAYDKAGNYSDFSNIATATITLPFTFTKTVDKTTANIGDTLKYTLTYKNDSSYTLSNLKIKDSLSSNVDYVSGSATGGGSYDASNRTLEWQIGSLQPGGQGSVQFQVQVLGGTEIVNKAEISFAGGKIESNTVTTTISLPSHNITEDVNFSFSASLFAGLYGEIGVSLSSLGLKGAELAGGALRGLDIGFTITPVNNVYALKIENNSSTGAKIEGSLGKAEAGIVSATAVEAGLTANILNGIEDLIPNPLNDAQQSAYSLSIIFTSAASVAAKSSQLALLPGVGKFVEALADYITEADPYKTESSEAIELVGESGLLDVSLGAGAESKGKAEIGNDVVGGSIAGKMEKVTNLRQQDDWKHQYSFTISSGASLACPFIAGVTGQQEFTAGFKENESNDITSLFYGGSVDPGVGVAFTELHYIKTYRAEISPSLFSRIYNECQNNQIALFLNGVKCALMPGSLIDSSSEFESMISQYAQKGEATYELGEEEKKQVGLELSVDIGAALGVGGGIQIGFAGEIVYSNSFPTEKGYLMNGGRVAIEKYNRVPSQYREVQGIASFIQKMVQNVLNVSAFINELESAFTTLIQTIQSGVDTVVDWIEGGVNWVLSGVESFSLSGRGQPQAELVGYEIKTPIFAETREGISISFIPYKARKVRMLSRQDVQEVTMMKYGVNLNVKNADGTYLTSFPANSNTLRITVGDDQLRERGFDPAQDYQNLKIFWFNPDDNTWIEMPTTITRNADSTTLEAKPEKPGTYAGGIASLPPDREPPQITIISPQNGATTSLTPILCASITDPNLKADTIKFKIDGEEVEPVYRYADPSVSQYLALPSQPLTQASHRLEVYAEDKSGNHRSVDVSFTASSSTPKLNISFISLPFAPKDILSRMVDFQQVAVWTGTNYYISNELAPEIARGFWLKTSQNFEPSTLKPLGYAIPTDREFSLPLNRGWQAFGLPWIYPLPISGLLIEDMNGNRKPFSEAGNLVGPILFRWDGTKYVNAGLQQGMEKTLYPWFSYWVRVKEDCKLIFPKEPWNVKAQRGSNLEGFCLPIKAVFSDGASEDVYIGMGKQEITSPFPPPAPYFQGQKRIAIIKNGELLYIDIRKEGGKQEWRLAVKGDATLFFPNLSYLPKGWQVILTDGDKRYYLKTTSAIKVEGDKELKVEIGEGLITPLLINMLDARSVRGGVNISWSVNLPCQVKVAIKGADGRILRDLGMRASSSGLNSLFWDGKGQDGKPLPAGIYIIELTARDELNQFVRAIRMVNLR